MCGLGVEWKPTRTTLKIDSGESRPWEHTHSKKRISVPCSPFPSGKHNEHGANDKNATEDCKVRSLYSKLLPHPQFEDMSGGKLSSGHLLTPRGLTIGLEPLAEVEGALLVVEVLHLPHPKLGGLLRGGEHLPTPKGQQRGICGTPTTARARSSQLFQHDFACWIHRLLRPLFHIMPNRATQLPNPGLTLMNFLPPHLSICGILCKTQCFMDNRAILRRKRIFCFCLVFLKRTKIIKRENTHERCCPRRNEGRIES